MYHYNLRLRALQVKAVCPSARLPEGLQIGHHLAVDDPGRRAVSDATLSGQRLQCHDRTLSVHQMVTDS